MNSTSRTNGGTFAWLSAIAIGVAVLGESIVNRILDSAPPWLSQIFAALFVFGVIALFLFQPAFASLRAKAQRSILMSLPFVFVVFGTIGTLAWLAFVRFGSNDATPGNSSDTPTTETLNIPAAPLVGGEAAAPLVPLLPPTQAGPELVPRQPEGPQMTSQPHSRAEAQPETLDFGGSLDDFVDTSFDAWQPAKATKTVEIDWTVLNGWQPTAEIVASGSGQIGIMEADRRIVVASSTIRPGNAPMRLRIPQEIGLRKYGLVVRKFGGGSTFRQLSATGRVVFEKVLLTIVRKESLGGNTGALREFVPGGAPEQWTPVESIRHVDLDWPGLTDMSVHVEATLVVSSPLRPSGSGAIRLRELMSDDIVVTSDWYPPKPPGGVGTSRPYMPAELQLEMVVPRSSVPRRYQLEVGVAGNGVSVAAVGRIVITK